MIINRQTLLAAFKGFNTLFNGAFEGAPTQFDKVAMTVPSTGAEETYAWMGTTTRFREWLGDRIIQNLKSWDYTVKNKDFENTIGVDRNAFDDDKLGVYAPLFQQLGMDAKQHPDELVFALLKAGFASTCYDGQYFFDSDHPVLQADGTTANVSNTGGGGGAGWYLLCANRAIKPLVFQKRKDYSFVAMDAPTDEGVFSRKEYRYGVDARVNVGYGLWQLAYGSKQTLDVTAYAAARAAMMSFTGDNGKPLGIVPDLLVVSPANEKAGLDVLEAERLANGQSNVYRNTAKLLVSPWLS